MLIDLPPAYDLFSMADCQDLFLPRTDDRLDDDDFRIDEPVPGHSKNGYACTGAPLLDRGAEPFTYASSSSSDSDADNCFSDIEMPAAGRVDRKITIDTQSRSQSHSQTQTTMSSSSKSFVKQPEQDLALHSPGQLLGTPRDPKRRYEYPFPAHLCGSGNGDGDKLDILESAASSTSTTPGLTPAEGCLPSSTSSSLGLMALAAPMAGISNRISVANLPRYLQASGPSAIATQAPVPAPVPVPVPMPANGSGRLTNAFVALAPLTQALPVAGPSSAPATSPVPVTFTSPTIAAHPKLSRFNPADAPVPPGLRGRTTRTRKSASVSDSTGAAARPRQTGVSDREEPMLPGSVSVPSTLASRASAVHTTARS